MRDTGYWILGWEHGKTDTEKIMYKYKEHAVMDNGYWILRDRWDWWKKDTGRSDNSSIQYHTTVLFARSGTLDVGTPLGWTVKDDAPA